MGKQAIKKRIGVQQKCKCALSGKSIAKDFSLIDTDRINPKANGGTYTDENTRIVDPVEHMKRHGNYRERDPMFAQLKEMVDGREQLMKNVNGINNRILAMKRGTDHLDETTLNMLLEQLSLANKHLGQTDRIIEKHLKSMDHPMIKSAFGIKGLGAMTIAYMFVYIDIYKANSASAMWSYCGYDKASHERYEKGVSGGGNKRMRCVLYRMADSMIKTRAVYRDVYDAAKARYEASEKIVKSRNTQGKLVEVMWKDAKPCHRHGAAMRKMIKHFLADWWFVYREIEGLNTRPLYVEEYLGHTGIVKPKERGWIW